MAIGESLNDLLKQELGEVDGLRLGAALDAWFLAKSGGTVSGATTLSDAVTLPMRAANHSSVRCSIKQASILQCIACCGLLKSKQSLYPKLRHNAKQCRSAEIHRQTYQKEFQSIL